MASKESGGRVVLGGGETLDRLMPKMRPKDRNVFMKGNGRLSGLEKNLLSARDEGLRLKGSVMRQESERREKDEMKVRWCAFCWTFSTSQ